MNLYKKQIGRTTRILRLSLGRKMAHEIIYATLQYKSLDILFWLELANAIKQEKP